MPYLGNAPAEAYSNISYQDLTGGSGTTFTLDFPAGSPGELEVFVNNVRQEPSVAYTVSGTTLTMTGTIASTDDFYVVFQSKAQQTVRHPANTALEATSGTFSGALSMGSISGGIPNLIRIQTFTADGTYTKSSGATKALVYVVGGGGGGGGIDGSGSSTTGGGGGGGAGGMAMKLITSGLGDTEAVTVGDGGAGGPGGSGGSAGSAGGSSSFGSHCSATGGGGGSGGTASAVSNATIRLGGTGGVGSSGDINTTGQPGSPGIAAGTATGEACSGNGGSTIFGGAVRGKNGDQNGGDCDDLTQAGAGASGGVVTGTSGNYRGGNGANGIVVVFEYL